MFAKVTARKIIYDMKFFFLSVIIVKFFLVPFQEIYSSKESGSSAESYEKFSDAMKGVRFTGFFTVDGWNHTANESKILFSIF